MYVQQKLFKYISGKNEGQKKVAMTSPVTVQTTPGQGPACKSDFLLSFFLPYKYQVKLYMVRHPMPAHNACTPAHSCEGLHSKDSLLC